MRIRQVRTPPPDAMVLLGNVGEVQEVRERARERCGGFDGQRRQQRSQFREL